MSVFSHSIASNFVAVQTLSQLGASMCRGVSCMDSGPQYDPPLANRCSKHSQQRITVGHVRQKIRDHTTPVRYRWSILSFSPLVRDCLTRLRSFCRENRRRSEALVASDYDMSFDVMGALCIMYENVGLEVPIPLGCIPCRACTVQLERLR